MVLLTPEQLSSIADWFLPERPGPFVGPHVLNTGQGAAFADRWPDPAAVLAGTGGINVLLGNPGSLEVQDIQRHILGLVDAPQSFEPLLRSAFPSLLWDRLIFSLRAVPHHYDLPGYEIRRITSADLYQLCALSQDIKWISATWNGHHGLASSGWAWGAFRDGRLVSVACPIFVGQSYEDIGVVTELEHRGQGLSHACAAAVCHDIFARGRKPSWSTEPANHASRRVAQKLGFDFEREDVLYAAGVPIPAPATRIE